MILLEKENTKEKWTVFDALHKDYNLQPLNRPALDQLIYSNQAAETIQNKNILRQ